MFYSLYAKFSHNIVFDNKAYLNEMPVVVSMKLEVANWLGWVNHNFISKGPLEPFFSGLNRLIVAHLQCNVKVSRHLLKPGTSEHPQSRPFSLG